MQTARTQVTLSISYDDNRYTTIDSLLTSISFVEILLLWHMNWFTIFGGFTLDMDMAQSWWKHMNSGRDQCLLLPASDNTIEIRLELVHLQESARSSVQASSVLVFAWYRQLQGFCFYFNSWKVRHTLGRQENNVDLSMFSAICVVLDLSKALSGGF